MTRNHRIAVLAGDGIGPEVMREALRVLDAAASKFGFTVERTEELVGGAAIDACGTPLPEKTIAACDAAEAILFGSCWRPEVGSSPAQTASGSGGAAAAAQALQALLQSAPGTHLPGTRQSFSLARRHLCSRL